MSTGVVVECFRSLFERAGGDKWNPKDCTPGENVARIVGSLQLLLPREELARLPAAYGLDSDPVRMREMMSALAGLIPQAEDAVDMHESRKLGAPRDLSHSLPVGNGFENTNFKAPLPMSRGPVTGSTNRKDFQPTKSAGPTVSNYTTQKTASEENLGNSQRRTSVTTTQNAALEALSRFSAEFGVSGASSNQERRASVATGDRGTIVRPAVEPKLAKSVGSVQPAVDPAQERRQSLIRAAAEAFSNETVSRSRRDSLTLTSLPAPSFKDGQPQKLSSSLRDPMAESLSSSRRFSEVRSNSNAVPRTLGEVPISSVQSRPLRAEDLDIFAAPPAEMKLVPCSKCGRNFSEERVEKHSSVCKGDRPLTNNSRNAATTPTPSKTTAFSRSTKVPAADRADRDQRSGTTQTLASSTPLTAQMQGRDFASSSSRGSLSNRPMESSRASVAKSDFELSQSSSRPGSGAELLSASAHEQRSTGKPAQLPSSAELLRLAGFLGAESVPLDSSVAPITTTTAAARPTPLAKPETALSKSAAPAIPPHAIAPVSAKQPSSGVEQVVGRPRKARRYSLAAAAHAKTVTTVKDVPEDSLAKSVPLKEDYRDRDSFYLQPADRRRAARPNTGRKPVDAGSFAQAMADFIEMTRSNRLDDESFDDEDLSVTSEDGVTGAPVKKADFVEASTETLHRDGPLNASLSPITSPIKVSRTAARVDSPVVLTHPFAASLPTQDARSTHHIDQRLGSSQAPVKIEPEPQDKKSSRRSILGRFDEAMTRGASSSKPITLESSADDSGGATVSSFEEAKIVSAPRNDTEKIAMPKLFENDVISNFSMKVASAPASSDRFMGGNFEAGAFDDSFDSLQGTEENDTMEEAIVEKPVRVVSSKPRLQSRSTTDWRERAEAAFAAQQAQLQATQKSKKSKRVIAPAPKSYHEDALMVGNIVASSRRSLAPSARNWKKSKTATVPEACDCDSSFDSEDSDCESDLSDLPVDLRSVVKKGDLPRHMSHINREHSSYATPLQSAQTATQQTTERAVAILLNACKAFNNDEIVALEGSGRKGSSLESAGPSIIKEARQRSRFVSSAIAGCDFNSTWEEIARRVTTRAGFGTGKGITKAKWEDIASSYLALASA